MIKINIKNDIANATEFIKEVFLAFPDIANTVINIGGTTSFKEQLNEGGLPITDKLEDDIDCLCMGFDTELTFKKLEDACILLGRNIDYIATNPDWVCPTWYGFVPDCGSVSEMLYNATKRRPKFIGKPQPEMALLAMEKTGFSVQILVI